MRAAIHCIYLIIHSQYKGLAINRVCSVRQKAYLIWHLDLIICKKKCLWIIHKWNGNMKVFFWISEQITPDLPEWGGNRFDK